MNPGGVPAEASPKYRPHRAKPASAGIRWGAVGRGVAANRISNHFGFTGPSLVIDSGQSSSLVAVHLACESLRTGECEVALAGGSNLILSPLGGARYEQFGAHSPTAKCHTFDECADGTVRGEGGGMVVLKPLALAAAAGDRIYAVIRGSAVNNGIERQVLSAPSVSAQAAVVRAALAAAAVAPGSVKYVELHGTGTPRAIRWRRRLSDVAAPTGWGLVRSAQTEYPGRIVLLRLAVLARHPAAAERHRADGPRHR
jgi:acyl transferase domain-containing protein